MVLRDGNGRWVDKVRALLNPHVGDWSHQRGAFSASNKSGTWGSSDTDFPKSYAAACDTATDDASNACVLEYLVTCPASIVDFQLCSQAGLAAES